MKKNKGITLITLVITIVILLILSGISISAINNVGIFSKAKKAVSKYKTSEVKEKIELFKYTNQIEENKKELKDFLIEEKIVTEEEINKEPIISVTEDVILLNNYEGLKIVANKVNNGEDFTNKTIYLLNDIDAGAKFDIETGELKEGENFETIGYSNCTIDKENTDETNITMEFNGIFDGENHKISNIYINKSEDTDFCTALFGCIGTEGKVQDLTISNSYIKGHYETGAIVGRNKGQIINCVNESKVIGEGPLTGGIAGRNTNTIESCVNKGNIVGKEKQVGGIVGNCDFGQVTVKNCSNYGEINAKGNATGGIAGGIYTTKEKNEVLIENCNNYAKVENEGENQQIGGIVGVGAIGIEKKIKINKCTNQGIISGYSKVGGIIGYNYGEVDVENCINKGSTKAEYELSGGITGYNNGGTISKCINLGNILLGESGRYGSGGIAGRNGGNYQAVSKIELCCNLGDIIAPTSTLGQAAGIAGNADSGDNMDNIIINCYNSGNITGSKSVGGIAGYIKGLKIENCYNKGNVKTTTSSIPGGIIGANGGIKECKNNYWLNTCGATSGDSINQTNDEMENKTEKELKELAKILGSEFTNDSANINQGYPILMWQKSNNKY